MKPLALLLLAVLSLSACRTAERAVMTATDAVADAAGATYNSVEDLFDGGGETAYAAALVRPTSAASQAQGTARFRESDGGLVVAVSLRGLTPGEHAVHLHENADCGMGDADGDGRPEPGGAAGGHWDPMETMDHGASSDPMTDKHLGDLGNVTVGADGTVSQVFAVGRFPVNEYSVGERAVVVHAGRDDLETDPGGGAGARVACGVVEARTP